jgi:transposase
MLQSNYIENILGIKDIIITSVNQTDTELHISFDMKKTLHSCPCCNTSTEYIHDYRNQTIKEVSAFGKVTYLHLRKRRYICKHCGKRFYENTPFLPRYHRMTSRLINSIIQEMKSTQSLKSVAMRANVSIPTVCRVFNYINYSLLNLPNVLSIDEFKGNTSEGKYQCIITDPHNHKVLDILKSRESHVLVDYFKQFNNRKDVKYFVMDMWKPYKEIAETFFKNATIVIDKYHFIRQVLWAFERVRKVEQKKFIKERRLYFKRSKKLLLKRMKSLASEDKAAVELMLQASQRLREAYLLKEKFLEFVDSEDIHSAKKNLLAWYLYVDVSNVPEFDECSKTIKNWEKFILNSFICPYTNGFTEGCNNKIKVLKRNSYGVKNFKRFRSRILHMMAG